ncbi:3-oxoacyl-ACP reductase FabG [Longispora albida]|uniref:3-oxoacyl-ACP reductase FabG n=1 Tax=Longispora albida TaxID=203523 RepID=UPI0003813384|nr:3-oxoacyl-ACP reductase FabG [Longispora albida]
MGSKRVALVSGGSRGIGRAAVLSLAEAGYAVSFCYRSDAEAAHSLVDMIRARGQEVLSEQVDVTDGQAVHRWVSRTERELGPIDAAVISAGITRDGPLVSMSDSDWNQAIATNLGGAFHVSRAAIFPMLKRRSGSITAIASVAGMYGNAGQVNYSAAKAGLIGFCRALAKEVGPYGVRVNVVVPGFIDTDMTSVLSDRVRKEAVDHIALGRFGTAEEAADLVAYLASDKATYVTGAVMEVHGAISI